MRPDCDSGGWWFKSTLSLQYMPPKCTRRHASFVLWKKGFESSRGLFCICNYISYWRNSLRNYISYLPKNNVAVECHRITPVPKNFLQKYGVIKKVSYSKKFLVVFLLKNLCKYSVNLYANQSNLHAPLSVPIGSLG